MSKYTVQEHNAFTGEIKVRPMNEEELSQLEIDKTESNLEREAIAQAATDKAALLAKLGITAAEAKLLLS